MKVKVKLLSPFSDAAGKSELVMEFDGGTVEDLIGVLAEKYPKLKNEFYSSNGEITDYLAVFVNDKPAHTLDDEKTGLKDGDELLFFVPVAGG
jgi:MoaD family protein